MLGGARSTEHADTPLAQHDLLRYIPKSEADSDVLVSVAVHKSFVHAVAFTAEGNMEDEYFKYSEQRVENPADDDTKLSGRNSFAFAHTPGTEAKQYVSPALEYCPVGHCRQLVDADDAEYFPAPHVEHKGSYFPVDEYWPGGQVCP